MANKLFFYALPITAYFFVFFFSVVYLSAKWQRSCVDVGSRFVCVENRYRNGVVFHDRNETLRYEECVAAYARPKVNATYAAFGTSSDLFYYYVGSVFASFFAFSVCWYNGVRLITSMPE